MPILIDHAPVSQPDGTVEYGPGTVPGNATRAVATIARATTATPTFWPNETTKLDVNLFLSTGGGPFVFLAGFSGAGGILVFGTGPEAPASTITVPLPPGSQRRARVEITVAGGPLVTQLTLEVL
jgi:hypothetical protein